MHEDIKLDMDFSWNFTPSVRGVEEIKIAASPTQEYLAERESKESGEPLVLKELALRNATNIEQPLMYLDTALAIHDFLLFSEFGSEDHGIEIPEQLRVRISIYLTRSTLVKLYNNCKTILEDTEYAEEHAQQLLPTRDGVYSGEYYDQLQYVMDVLSTMEVDRDDHETMEDPTSIWHWVDFVTYEFSRYV